MWLYHLKKWMENNEIELRGGPQHAEVPMDASGTMIITKAGDRAVLDNLHYKRHKPIIWNWLRKHNIHQVSDLLDQNNQLQMHDAGTLDGDVYSDLEQTVQSCYTEMKRQEFAPLPAASPQQITPARVTNLCNHKLTETAMKWMARHRNNPNKTIVGCSDGSVFDHRVEGGYAWALYERLLNGDLREIEIWGAGKERVTGLDVTAIHSYRTEATAILAALSTLEKYGWKGKVEWHIDCTGVIKTYDKLPHMRYTNWYAQRDKDVWERIKLIRPTWRKRFQMHHVKAHVDKEKDRELSPEERGNTMMDMMAKTACQDTDLASITGLDGAQTWGIYMHDYRVTGHTKDYVMKQIQIDRLKNLMRRKPGTGGKSPNEISYQHMISTAPAESQTKYEAMFMWHELPTNDRTMEWNICNHTDCKVCGAAMENNEHFMHNCVDNKMIQLRQIASEGIVNEFRSKNTHPLLIEILAELYGIKQEGSTNRHTVETMPESWKAAEQNCPETGHEYVELCLQGLAAETVIMLGNTSVIWNGMFTKAMVRMLEIGGIEPAKIRKHIKAVRTIIYALKTEMWKHRNECNFDEHVERERLEEKHMREEIDAHIRTNDAAQKSAYNAQAVMDMAPEERSKWMEDTKDRGTVQRTLHSFFNTSNRPGNARTRRMPAATNHADSLAAVLSALPDSGPIQQRINTHFQTKSLQRNNVGKLTKQQYSDLEAKEIQKRALDLKEYKTQTNIHKRMKRKAARKTEPVTSEIDPDNIMGDGTLRGCNQLSMKPASGDSRELQDRSQDVQTQHNRSTAPNDQNSAQDSSGHPAHNSAQNHQNSAVSDDGHKAEPVVFRRPDQHGQQLDKQAKYKMPELSSKQQTKPKYVKKMPIGSRVKIKNTRFDTTPGSWSKGRPEWAYGTMVAKKPGGVIGVRWDGYEDEVWDSHWKHLVLVQGVHMVELQSPEHMKRKAVRKHRPRKKKTAPTAAKQQPRDLPEKSYTNKNSTAQMKIQKMASDADEQARYEEYMGDLDADSDTGDSDSDEEYGGVCSSPQMNSAARVVGGARVRAARRETKRHDDKGKRNCKRDRRTVNLDTDDDTDEERDEQQHEPKRLKIADFFQKTGHKPGPRQQPAPKVKAKGKEIDMSKIYVDV